MRELAGFEAAGSGGRHLLSNRRHRTVLGRRCLAFVGRHLVVFRLRQAGLGGRRSARDRTQARVTVQSGTTRRL